MLNVQCPLSPNPRGIQRTLIKPAGLLTYRQATGVFPIISVTFVCAQKAGYSSGTVRDSHPVPFSSPSGEPIMAAKVRISEKKTKTFLIFLEREYLRAKLKGSANIAKNQNFFEFF